MNAQQSAKLNMFKAVVKQLTAEAAAIATVPALKKAFDLFVAKVAAIIALIPNQQDDSTGETLTKEQARSILETAFDELSDQVYAWAAQNEDEMAKQKADLTISGIRRMKGNVLAAEAEAFYDYTVEHKAALADFGVTDETLSDFTGYIDDYTDSAELPRNKISSRTTQTGNLATLFAEADKLLNEQVKKLMVSLRKKYPDVYNTFLNNSKILDAPAASAKTKAANAAKKKTEKSESADTPKP